MRFTSPAAGAFAIVMILAALAALVAAAPSTGTQPTASRNTLWIHRNSDESVYWLSNVKDEPAHNDPDPGYNVLGATSGPGYLWSIPLDPAPTGPIQLAPDTAIEFSVYLKAITSVPVVGGVPQGAGTGSVEMTLKSGGAAIATGEAQDVTLEPDTWAAIKWSIKPTVTAISGDLVWDILFEGASGGAVLGAADEFGWTNMVLPIVGGDAPDVLQETLAGPTVEVRHVFANKTTANYQYNWTNGLSDPRLEAITNGTGNWTLTVLDNGTPRFQQTFEANGTASDALDGAGAGNWTLLLNVTGFTGALAVLIDETPSATSTSSSGSGSARPTTSASSTSSEAEDTPAPSLTLLIAALAFSAMVLRRRRA